ncbi:MAG: CoA transferase [Proteobacteria bacterium]|nr:CoA transferase [Pseudomonadota bacterium]
MGPLAGVKILDLSRVLAGPWATQCLADFGATVWKIEKPGSGDDTRQWGPPWLNDRCGRASGESAYYLSANRGKQSVAIDISQPRGQALIKVLAQRVDVLVENFKVGGLAKYGLDYASLQPLNQSLIYCSISAFGQDGPEAAGAGYDAMMQGKGGLMSLTGNPEDEPGGSPQKVGVAVCDLMTGMYAVAAILGALYERRGSGLGQHIDLALLDTQVAMLANQNMNFLLSGQSPKRMGTAHPNLVPYQAVRAQDGDFMLAVGNDRQFADFCRVAGQEAAASDVRYATNSARIAHRRELVEDIGRWCGAHPRAWWLEQLGRAHVPCGPINDLAAVFEEPQVKHRRMRLDLPHPLSGSVPQVRNPVLYSRTTLDYGAAPPLLGQQTAQVLAAQTGSSPEQLAELRALGVIG